MEWLKYFTICSNTTHNCSDYPVHPSIDTYNYTKVQLSINDLIWDTAHYYKYGTIITAYRDQITRIYIVDGKIGNIKREKIIKTDHTIDKTYYFIGGVDLSQIVCENKFHKCHYTKRADYWKITPGYQGRLVDNYYELYYYPMGTTRKVFGIFTERYTISCTRYSHDSTGTYNDGWLSNGWTNKLQKFANKYRKPKLLIPLDPMYVDQYVN